MRVSIPTPALLRASVSRVEAPACLVEGYRVRFSGLPSLSIQPPTPCASGEVFRFWWVCPVVALREVFFSGALCSPTPYKKPPNSSEGRTAALRRQNLPYPIPLGQGCQNLKTPIGECEAVRLS